MNFQVIQINMTSLFNDQTILGPSVNLWHCLFLSSVIFCLLVNTFHFVETLKLHHGFWSHPIFFKLNIYLIVATIFIPVIILSTGFFFIYKSTVNILLRHYYKHKFRGLLSGPDSLWTLEDKSSSVVNILVIVHYKNHGLFPQVMCNKLKQINGDPDLWKLNCNVSYCMGYPFLLENEESNSPRVRKLDYSFYSNREVLQDLLSQFASVDIAEGRLWETFLGVEEISWGDKRNCYPLVVRFHHVLGDVLALLQLVHKCLKFETQEVVIGVAKEDIAEKKEYASDDLMETMVKITIHLMHFVLVLWKLPTMILKYFEREPDENYLHSRNLKKKLNGKKLITWKVENGYKYINRMNIIKRRYGGAGFMEIIAASVGYSFQKFFNNKGWKHINYLNAVIPAITQASKFTNMNNNSGCNLTNRFSIGIFKLPLWVNSTVTSLKRGTYWRCAQTISNLYDLRTSHEFQLNYWLMNIIMGVMPRIVTKFFVRSLLGLSTMVISNLPGPRRIYFNDGSSKPEDNENYIEDIVFWTPHRGLLGVSTSIFSYDDRFQLGLSLDTIYGVTSMEAEDILEGIFQYIDKLHEELIEQVHFVDV